jgi:NhaP-type Na+/H+ or K+/H+ antiporter
MHADIHANPGLTVALALAVGMVAQSLARHLRIPGIVLLLGAGVLLGPDGLGMIQPEALGEGLQILIGFAVAVILFEGGLSLSWRRMRDQAVAIRRLLSLGAAITALGGTLAAKLALGWDWPMAILFGTLVIVTGPTVITPLLRRIKVQRRLETILETEGVLVDAIGAIVAVVALEVVLSPSGSSLALGFMNLPQRLLFGALLGLAGGVLLAITLRFERIVPEGLENIFVLSSALAIYQISNALIHETGIVSVIVAGMVVGNVRGLVQRELREFKEQLTVLLIGMLFVLLAADVRLREIAALGVPGLTVVLALMFIVRPAAILSCTWGAGITWRQKAFLAWVAPRGIVAAAVASLFHDQLAAAGIGGGNDMRAMVFLVIAATVFFQGATAEFVAGFLRLRRPTGMGYAILGANPLARAMGRLLRQADEKVVLIDADALTYQEAEEEDCRVVYGNGLEERVLLGAGIESRKAVMGMLSNGAVNILFARKARREFKVPRAYVAIQRGHGAINREMVEQAGATVLFAADADLDLWSVRLRRELAAVQIWRRGDADAPPEGTEEIAAKTAAGPSPVDADKDAGKDVVGGAGKEAGRETEKEPVKDPLVPPREVKSLLLPLAIRLNENIVPVDSHTRVRDGDEVYWLVFTERADEAAAWLRQEGWAEGVPAT